MATYMELSDLMANGELCARLGVSCAVAADTIRTEPSGTANHTNRLLWAKDASTDPKGMSKRLLPMLIAQNKTSSTAQILAASDTAIQTAVDSVVDIFATG